MFAQHDICDKQFSSVGHFRADDQAFNLYQGSAEIQDTFLQRDVICRRKGGYTPTF